MKLTIEFPRISPAIENGTVGAWHKQPGDAIAYGDDLFDITIGEVTRMRRSLSARVKKPSKAKYRKLSDVSVVYRVTSMDAGTLGEIVAPVGAAIEVGDVVAHLEIGDGEGTSSARTSFNLVGSNEETPA